MENKKFESKNTNKIISSLPTDNELLDSQYKQNDLLAQNIEISSSILSSEQEMKDTILNYLVEEGASEDESSEVIAKLDEIQMIELFDKINEITQRLDPITQSIANTTNLSEISNTTTSVAEKTNNITSSESNSATSNDNSSKSNKTGILGKIGSGLKNSKILDTAIYGALGMTGMSSVASTLSTVTSTMTGGDVSLDNGNIIENITKSPKSIIESLGINLDSNDSADDNSNNKVTNNTTSTALLPTQNNDEVTNNLESISTSTALIADSMKDSTNTLRDINKTNIESNTETSELIDIQRNADIDRLEQQDTLQEIADNIEDIDGGSSKGGMFNKLSRRFKKLGGGLINKVNSAMSIGKNLITKSFSSIVGKSSSIVTSIADMSKSSISSIGDSMSILKSKSSSIMTSLSKGSSKLLSSITDKLGGMFGKLTGKLGGLLSGKGGGLLGKLGGMVSGSGGGLMSKVGSIGGKLGGVLGGASKFLGPIAALGTAAYGGFKGWNQAGENFDIEEGKEATMGQKMSSALGGALDSVSFGLLDGKSMSKGIHSIGSSIGDFFGFGGDDKKDNPITTNEALVSSDHKSSLVSEKTDEVSTTSVSDTENKSTWMDTIKNVAMMTPVGIVGKMAYDAISTPSNNEVTTSIGNGELGSVPNTSKINNKSESLSESLSTTINNMGNVISNTVSHMIGSSSPMPVSQPTPPMKKPSIDDNGMVLITSNFFEG